MHQTNCPLCIRTPENELWHNAKLRVIDADDPAFPGFTRVIWNDHVAEMTDLESVDRQYLMEAVWIVENTLRNELMPLKVNIAQFGNYVPHLHWHIIPRWPLDTHFPDAVWAAPRERTPEQLLAWDVFREQLLEQLPAYHTALRISLNTLG